MLPWITQGYRATVYYTILKEVKNFLKLQFVMHSCVYQQGPQN